MESLRFAFKIGNLVGSILNGTNPFMTEADII